MGTTFYSFIAYDIHLVFIVAVSAVVFGYDISSFIEVKTVIADQWDLSYEQSFILLPLNIFVTALGTIVCGSRLQIYGRKPSLFGATFIHCTSMFVISLISSYYIFVVCRVLMSLAVGVIFNVAPLYIHEVAPRDKQGSCIILENMMVTVGYICGSITSGLLLTYQPVIGWRIVYLLGASIGFVVSFTLYFIPESPRFLACIGLSEEALRVLVTIRRLDANAEGIRDEVNALFASHAPPAIPIPVIGTETVDMLIVMGEGEGGGDLSGVHVLDSVDSVDEITVGTGPNAHWSSTISNSVQYSSLQRKLSIPSFVDPAVLTAVMDGRASDFCFPQIYAPSERVLVPAALRVEESDAVDAERCSPRENAGNSGPVTGSGGVGNVGGVDSSNAGDATDSSSLLYNRLIEHGTEYGSINAQRQQHNEDISSNNDENEQKNKEDESMVSYGGDSARFAALGEGGRRQSISRHIDPGDLSPSEFKHRRERYILQHRSLLVRYLWCPNLRKELHLGVGLWVISQLIGIDAVVYFGTEVVRGALFSNENAASSSNGSVGNALIISSVIYAILQAVQLCGNVAGYTNVDKVGRKPLTLISLSAVFVSLTVLVYGLGKNKPIFSLIGLFSYLLSFGAGISFVPFVINTSIYPIDIRSKCLAIASLISWIANLLVTTTFLPLAEVIGQSLVFAIYAAITLISIVWVWFVMPETLNVKLLEMDEAFEAMPGG